MSVPSVLTCWAIYAQRANSRAYSASTARLCVICNSHTNASKRYGRGVPVLPLSETCVDVTNGAAETVCRPDLGKPTHEPSFTTPLFHGTVRRACLTNGTNGEVAQYGPFMSRVVCRAAWTLR